MPQDSLLPSAHSADAGQVKPRIKSAVPLRVQV